MLARTGYDDIASAAEAGDWSRAQQYADEHIAQIASIPEHLRSNADWKNLLFCYYASAYICNEINDQHTDKIMQHALNAFSCLPHISNKTEEDIEYVKKIVKLLATTDYAFSLINKAVFSQEFDKIESIYKHANKNGNTNLLQLTLNIAKFTLENPSEFNELMFNLIEHRTAIVKKELKTLQLFSLFLSEQNAHQRNEKQTKSTRKTL